MFKLNFHTIFGGGGLCVIFRGFGGWRAGVVLGCVIYGGLGREEGRLAFITTLKYVTLLPNRRASKFYNYLWTITLNKHFRARATDFNPPTWTPTIQSNGVYMQNVDRMMLGNTGQTRTKKCTIYLSNTWQFCVKGASGNPSYVRPCGSEYFRRDAKYLLESIILMNLNWRNFNLNLEISNAKKGNVHWLCSNSSV